MIHSRDFSPIELVFLEEILSILGRFYLRSEEAHFEF